MAQDNPFRLPRTVIPARYVLNLAPDLAVEHFDGSVQIYSHSSEPVQEIQLHAADLKITRATITTKDDNEISAQPEMSEDDRLILKLDESAPAGELTINIEFNGSLASKLAGFYRSTFRDADGTEHKIATTQFEPTDARRAFPCFDEPDLKAVFEISLLVNEDLLAVSNAHLVSEESRGEGKKLVKFAPTMQMSTYLVAFIVGPLVATEAINVDGVDLRVICIPGRENLAEFALKSGAAALRYFTDYFGIAYPGDKLDLVGIPDFNFGAMENLGCVTFRETALLVDSKNASRLELERVADVVAHEIAHMWFGDLVTMKWWNGIWLNEAFATFMELMMVDNFKPEWQRWTSFGISRAYALGTDGLASTRTIEYPVLHPRDAEGMFDVAITYQKGGAVVRMLEQYLEPGEFKSGITRYLDTHQYGNTETTDLWDAIEAATGEPVRALMDTWIFQEGHPVISVERAENTTDLILRQNRFLYAGARGSETRWHVPIRLRASVNGVIENRKVLLTDEQMTISLPTKVDWVVVNDGSWGFFRVKYSSDLLHAIKSQLESLSPLERFTLLSDSWASVLSGNSPVSDYLELLRLYGKETDPDVWSTIVSSLEALRRAAPDADKAQVESFTHALCSPAFEQLGWEPKPDEPQRLNNTRSVLLSALAIVANDATTQLRCVEMLASDANGGTSINPDLIQTIVNVCAYIGDEARFDQYCDRIKSATTPQEEVRYLRALGRFNNRELVQKAVLYTLTDNVRPQDGMFVLAGAMANSHWGQQAWELIKQNWEELTTRLASSTMGRSIEASSDQFISGLAADIRSFTQTHPVEQSERLIAQTIEHLEVNEAFANRLGDSIHTVLSA